MGACAHVQEHVQKCRNNQFLLKTRAILKEVTVQACVVTWGSERIK